MKITFKSPVVQAWFPDQPQHGDQCFLFLQGTPDDAEGYCPLLYEVFRATFQVVEDGDAESGPSAHLEPGEWVYIGGGMGHSSLEEEMARYHDQSQNPTQEEEYTPRYGCR